MTRAGVAEGPRQAFADARDHEEREELRRRMVGGDLLATPAEDDEEVLEMERCSSRPPWRGVW